MKLTKYIFGVVVLFMLGLVSCEDELSVDLSQRKYVRINKQTVSLAVGEKTILKTVVDSLGSASKSFRWSVLDGSVASIEAGDNNSAIVTGVAVGTTVVQVESTDGQLKYFTDLTVTADRVIKILAIGNKVSEDAVENYLHDLAKDGGYRTIISNLYLDGSSLQRHWENASARNPVYELRGIGSDGNRVTLNDLDIPTVIMSENWDFISFQEASYLAGVQEGYQEYLPQLVELTRSLAANPELKVALHQPWAYSEDATDVEFGRYDNDQVKMYNAIVNAVDNSVSRSGIDLVIPTGTAIQNGRTTYLGDLDYLGDLLSRDGGLLLSLVRGRFIAASTWYDALFDEDVRDNPFTISSLSAYENELLKESAHAAVEESKEITPLTAYRYPEGFELNTHELTTPIYIDFGPRHSSVPFNNFSRPTDPKITDLKDQNWSSTFFEMVVNEPFTGVLERGLGNNLGYPHSASEDMFFSDGNLGFPVSSFALSNFNKDQKYTFVFYGHINDGGTQTEYRVIGKNTGVDYLVTDNNMNNVAIVPNIAPTDYGTLIIRLTKGPNNTHWAGFFGINAMVIFPEGYPIPGM